MTQRSEKRQRTRIVGVRVTASELERLAAAAAADGLSLAGFVRDCALVRAEESK